ncbi:DUF4114 domain-containing protein [Flavobacterium sp. TSSA_36]|uniref:DUF4114 domain-containing protein n=1 Tax=Flavobacterium sp. TSSA_36 TaxID=3447669 RepID=UPI003F2CB8F4
MKTALLFLVLLLTSFGYSQGYKFLGSYTSDGTPMYFDTKDVVNAATLALVSNSLPENYPVPTYNPQYISSGYDTNIVVTKPADVWVTFVSEGAGYRNVLGFYTYDINNPPTAAPSSSDITIIFPNVSGQGSGGSLLAGDKVKIGTFPAGTGIGWVLLANAWNGSAVTNGLWRLFSDTRFNPEGTASLRQHNVLLNDPTNQRILLGFEDIRRDYGNCDQDFNDAIFYITANPYDAITSENIADVSISNNVTSGNNGGLESEGSLAVLIAKRNFSRMKNNSYNDKKETQKKYIKSSAGAKSAAGIAINSLLPVTAMYGSETSTVSSPNDLKSITNATEVFSVDYYQANERVAAVLATTTQTEVYSHSKAICDRLNSSSLEDIRTITIDDFEMIMSKIKRENGALEYALHFSILNPNGTAKLQSYWNLSQYPKGDYLNFQVWGMNMGQVCSITNSIIKEFKAKAALTQDVVSDKIPAVFIRKGVYKDGKLTLSLVNKSKATSLLFTGNKKVTEFSSIDNFTKNLTLSGSYTENVEVDTGYLFDLGLSIQENNTSKFDAAYMADGPWGLDYQAAETVITKFEINNIATKVSKEVASSKANLNDYMVERDVKVEGTVKGTVNLFRNLLPGELVLDATGFSYVKFKVENSKALEMVLVTENLTDWNKRYRLQVDPNLTAKELSISFADFKNAQGQSYNNEKLKGFVFSTIGDYASFQSFAIAINDLRLSTNGTLGINDFSLATNKIFSYPNPCSVETTIVLPEFTEEATVKIIGVLGNLIQNYNQKTGSNEVKVNVANLNKGIYFFEVTTKENKKYSNKFIVN